MGIFSVITTLPAPFLVKEKNKRVLKLIFENLDLQS